MAGTYTFTVDSANTILAPLALTSTPDTYTWTVSAGLRLPVWTVSLMCDAAFSFANTSGGNYFAVPANTRYDLTLLGTTVLYFKTATTATLSVLSARGFTGM